MSNELNEPQSDLFEDSFWDAIGEIHEGAFIPYYVLKYAVEEAHAKCGGEPGDEPYDYGKMLLKEHNITVGDKNEI